jgi:hypothetical protein
MHHSVSLWKLIEALQERGLSDAEVVATVVEEMGRLLWGSAACGQQARVGGRRAVHRGFCAGESRRAPRRARGERIAERDARVTSGSCPRT